jgi:hypothetical protein
MDLRRVAQKAEGFAAPGAQETQDRVNKRAASALASPTQR